MVPSTKSEQISQTVPSLSIILRYLCATLPPFLTIFDKSYRALQKFELFNFSIVSKNSFARTFSRIPLIIPESLTQICPAIPESINLKQLDSPPLHTSNTKSSLRSLLISQTIIWTQKSSLLSGPYRGVQRSFFVIKIRPPVSVSKYDLKPKVPVVFLRNF